MEQNALYTDTNGQEWRCEESGIYSVLDYGYLEMIRSWGSDEEIIETARMSTDKGFLGWDPGPCPTCSSRGVLPPEAPGIAGPAIQRDPPAASRGSFAPCPDCGGKGTIPGDAKLLAYLYEHKHSTPFEFAGLTIEVQAPIMVFREWHRHRTQSYSEMSARYVQMPNIHYVPSIQRILDSSKKSGNRQVSGAGVLVHDGLSGFTQEELAEVIQRDIRAEQQKVYDQYERLLKMGVSKEIARIDTPVSRYSRMRATGNLRNWLAFLTLRMDPAAQFEIRQFAWCVGDVIEQEFPRTWALHLASMHPKAAVQSKRPRVFPVTST